MKRRLKSLQFADSRDRISRNCTSGPWRREALRRKWQNDRGLRFRGLSGCAPQEVHTDINSATFASDADVTLLSSSRNLKVSSPTVYAQDRTAPPITAFYLSDYSRRRHPVSVVSGLVTRGIECRSTVPAQTVGVLPGTPGSAPQAHRRSALLLGFAAAIASGSRIGRLLLCRSHLSGSPDIVKAWSLSKPWGPSAAMHCRVARRGSRR